LRFKKIEKEEIASYGTEAVLKSSEEQGWRLDG